MRGLEIVIPRENQKINKEDKNKARHVPLANVFHACVFVCFDVIDLEDKFPTPSLVTFDGGLGYGNRDARDMSLEVYLQR